MTYRFLILICVGILSSAPTSAVPFTDNFNRPDSTTVGNGWTSVATNGQSFQILDGRAIFPYPDAMGGIFHPESVADIAELTATFTAVNGYAGLQDRYGTAGIGILSDGTLNSGYRIEFYRGDQNFSDSSLTFFDGALRLGTIKSPFQFGAQISTTINFSLSQGVTGTVGDGTNSFIFTFGPYQPTSSGTNILLSQGGPDSRASTYTFPTIDDVTFNTDALFPQRPPSPLQTPDLAPTSLLVVLGVISLLALAKSKQAASDKPATWREPHGVRFY